MTLEINAIYAKINQAIIKHDDAALLNGVAAYFNDTCLVVADILTAEEMAVYEAAKAADKAAYIAAETV